MPARSEMVLEYVWIGVIVAMLASFAGTLLYVGETMGIWTPENAVTCDVKRLEEYIEPGVREIAPGVYEVNIIGRQWAWIPSKIVLQDPRKVIFRVTSADVIHGFEIVGTPVNVMVLPGYIAEVTWIPPRDLNGTLLIVCNEYCGIGHDRMVAELVIVRTRGGG